MFWFYYLWLSGMLLDAARSAVAPDFCLCNITLITNDICLYSTPKNCSALMGPPGPKGPQGFPGSCPTCPGSIFAMFYGLTNGTGNPGSTNYPNSIPAKTSPGTGRVPFPIDGPNVGIARLDDSSFSLPKVGVYEIKFSVQVLELGQLELEINDEEVVKSLASNMNDASGGHPIVGNIYVSTLLEDSVMALINPPGNSASLNIAPSSQSNSHANVQSILIRLVA